MTLDRSDIIDLTKMIADQITMPSETRWLRLKQASAYANIGRNRLKELALSGRIIGYSDPDSGRGDWVSDKISIDKYRLSYAKSDDNYPAITSNGNRHW